MNDAVGLPLTDVVERNRRDEERRAAGALLRHPLLPRSHPAFALVRRHADTLREWFGRETGWKLEVGQEFARLYKRPADLADDSRPARPSRPDNAPPFSRRRYALFCLALADLERGEIQITLGRLGEGLTRAAADPLLAARGLVFALENRDERRDLVAVARLLIELGVLVRVAGDEESFIDARERDVLYDVNRHLLATLLVTRRGPSLVDGEGAAMDLEARLAAISEGFVADTREARNSALRRRLTARLLDDPVLYWDELDEEARAYLTSQRPHITRRIAEFTGLVAEVRREGVALVDRSGELSDLPFPYEGTEGHATLLLADRLAAGGEPRTLASLHAEMRDWIDLHRTHWNKGAQAEGAEVALTAQAVERLRALKLVRLEGERVIPLPAIARHRLG
ncbi:TIGR02678 family protein [Endothiovibrio diazotrophicus]